MRLYHWVVLYTRKTRGTDIQWIFKTHKAKKHRLTTETKRRILRKQPHTANKNGSDPTPS